MQPRDRCVGSRDTKGVGGLEIVGKGLQEVDCKWSRQEHFASEKLNNKIILLLGLAHNAVYRKRATQSIVKTLLYHSRVSTMLFVSR